MAWQNPKTDWVTNPKNPVAEDFNRIEGNIAFLKQEIEMKKGVIVSAINDMNQPAEITDSHDVLAQKIRNISKDATAAVGDVLSGKTFYAGGVKQNGAMPNHGGIKITPGFDNIVIPAGYHDGTGYVRPIAPPLTPPQYDPVRYALAVYANIRRFSYDIEGLTYQTVFEVRMKHSGRIAVWVHFRNSPDGVRAYVRALQNGVQVGETWDSVEFRNYWRHTATTDVEVGDILTIQGRSEASYGSCEVSGVAICVDENFDNPFVETLVRSW